MAFILTAGHWNKRQSFLFSPTETWLLFWQSAGIDFQNKSHLSFTYFHLLSRKNLTSERNIGGAGLRSNTIIIKGGVKVLCRPTFGKESTAKIKQNKDFPSSQCISTLSSVKRQKRTLPAPPPRSRHENAREVNFSFWFAEETGEWAGRILQRPWTPQKLVLSHRGIVGNGRRCPSFWGEEPKTPPIGALAWRWNGACPWFGAEVFGRVSSDPWNGGNNAGRGLRG